jgi:hypothetical protein
MITKRARITVGSAIVILLGAAVALGGLVIAESINRPAQLNAVSTAEPSGGGATAPVGRAGIPVLVYHEMDNGCAPAASVCDSHDPESVSRAQFTRQMNYLRSQGYHTVSLAQYEKWLDNPDAVLPRKPILLTADNGIGNFLEGAQPILARNGYTMTAFLVTGFADGAGGKCEAPREIAGQVRDLQPGCGQDNRGWDLTWRELSALSPRVYSFALEAGPSGHFPQSYSRTCTAFYACVIPGETTSAYKARVASDISRGLAELHARLPGRVNADAWVVPFSDLGYQRCGEPNCTPQDSTGPPGWLAAYAAARFSAVFVEDAYRNGLRHERFRFDVTGQLTQRAFETQLQGFIAAGSFARHPGR